MSEKNDRQNYLPANFNEMLVTFLDAAERMAGAVVAVAGVREPEKYRDCVDLVQAGRLIPRIVSQPGVLVISLIDTSTGESVGDIFQYTAPALAARGFAN